MKGRSRYPTLAAAAPELVDGIEKAEARRQRVARKVGGVKVRPATTDARATLHAEGRQFNVPPEQCLSAAAWYLAEAVCMGFTHQRSPNARGTYMIPCNRCLEAGTRAVNQMYEKGVEQ
jgi:hypothetical protein